MFKTFISYINGEYKKYSEINIGFLSNSLNFGTSIIESIRIHKKGDDYYFIGIDYYLDRFINTNNKTFYDFDLSKTDIKKILLTLLKVNKGIKNPYFRLVTFYGDDELNVIQDRSKFNFAVGIMDLKIPNTLLNATFSTFYRPNSDLNSLKLAMNYGRNLIDYYKANKEGFDTVLYLGEGNLILEGISENIFIVKGGKILTPKSGNILNGLNRKLILYILKDIMGYSLSEKEIIKDEALTADEIFYCGTASGIRNIRSIDGCILGDGEKYSVSKKILEFYNDGIFMEKNIGDINISKFNL